ncbi:MAG: undecaprenyl-diphosphate phosphatase [Clostridia bacterium]|nr:undecaprenyl-diphosphate phosphatase [Clostridia bacterium]
MSIIKAIILGIVQGVTEFLPISSSGHLSLFQHFLNVDGEGSLLFSVLLHLGTLIAVFIVFHKTIFELIVDAFGLVKDIFTGKFKFKQLQGKKKMLVMFVFSCIPLLLLLIPVGNDLKLMDVLGGLSEDDSILVEGFCFLFTGFLLLTSTYISKKKTLNREVNTLDAFAIGLAQVFAAGFPGISRSGSTISTGMICGVSKEYMVEYSFILGIPAIIVANAVELKDAVETGAQLELLPTIIGVIVAAVVGVACIKLLQWILKKDMWKYFGFYCLIIGVFTIICSALGI